VIAIPAFGMSVFIDVNFYKVARLEPSHSYKLKLLGPTFSTCNGLLVDITDNLNY